MSSQRTAEQAIMKLRLLSQLPKGTRVLANNWFSGVIDGTTTDGKYIVAFDTPVTFPSIGKEIYRACFEKSAITLEEAK